MAKNLDKLGISAQYEAPVVLLKKWVDFHYEVNGETFDFSLPGGGFISLYDLVEALEIAIDDAETEEDEIQAFMDAVVDVQFSTPELVSVSKVEEDTTVGAIKERLGLVCKYSAELTEEEIEDAYELNTGKLIVDEFARMGKDPEAVSAVICKNHGPFAWGKDPEDAVHCAVVLEEVAKMAFRTELINPKVQPAPQELQDKHYYRKHGANAYYGQGGAK